MHREKGLVHHCYNDKSLYPVIVKLQKHAKLWVRLIGHSKLPVGMNVSVDSCLSLYVSPVMN